MKQESPLPGVDARIYKKRRANLAKRMGEGVAVLPTAPEVARNRDSHFPYRFDSYFYYLTGFPEPEAVMVMVVKGKSRKDILFCRARDDEKEIWDGYRYGPALARELFGFDEAYPIDELDERMPELIADQRVLHTPVGMDSDLHEHKNWNARVTAWLNAVRAKQRMGIAAPTEIREVRATIDALRLVKDAHELAIMRRAADISAAAHVRAMRFTRPGHREYEVEAELLHEFRRHGAQSVAYGSIVGTGPNACILHYRAGDAVIENGHLVLIDAGCELDGYASDITRTYPANGKFSGPQRAIYELVLEAQKECIAAVKPGVAFNAYHDVAIKVLAQGLIDLKLCRGSLDKVIDKGDYKRFYMHRAGHWLGLDVHDAGDYRRDGKWVKLEPGMVLTVEPGLYIRPAKNVAEKWWNIGVRIEDDVLVTSKKPEVLTHRVPKEATEVEAVCRQ